MKHDVVITSYGIISPIGLNAEDFEKNLFAGKSGVKSIRGELVPDHFPVPYAAWIPRQVLPPSKLFASEKSDQILKSWLMTEQATMQALQNLKPSDHIDAIVFGTADGVSYEIVEEILKSSLPENYNYKNVCSESSLDIVRDTAIQLGFNKVPDKNLISLNSACATGNQTLGIAFHGLRSGRWNRCLVGGVDARCEASNFLNFFLLGALTTDDVAPEKASRPFAKDRSGFVRGEGSAVLVLETREAAVARGAKILGVISGYGCTSDAYRLTDGREDGASVIEAMKAALTDAHLQTKDIDYINAHGT
ncbi:MAG: beta-ketoacyl synthase N-terminal-like domain-containing protein, partial [Pseudobdellovibrionaceae bacterium]